MATVYLTPGVYMEEVDKGSKPISGVATAIAAFVGFAETGPLNQPTFITNWTQFTNTFGGFLPGGFLAHAIYGFFNNGGGVCYVTRLPSPSVEGNSARARDARAIAAAAELPARSNAGVGLEIRALAAGSAGSSISVQIAEPTHVEGQTTPEDTFTIVVNQNGEQVERIENVTLRRGRNARNVVETVRTESKLITVAERELPGSPLERTPPVGTSYALTLPAETAMVATKIPPATLIGSAPERSGVNGMEVADDVTMLAFPDLMALYQSGVIDLEGVQAVQQAMLDHCQNMRDRVAILDAPPGMKPQEIRDWRMKTANYDSKYGTLYYPWIKVANPVRNGSTGPNTIYVPPSGHMAGIWARSDGERGVHKAPANEVIAGAIGLEMQITSGEQSILNPEGINCIRAFPGRGIRVWGARTLSSDPSWRYLNVRRLFNYIEKSIQRDTQWTVFEPNDFDLWQRIKRDVSAFLVRCWRDGALFGATAAEAFYVKCDEELNSVEIRDVGQVIVEIGIAPVKPAEFVIFRLSQWQGGGSSEGA